ncbi:hypothetical protein [Nonomuraea sp. JJY05]|uniref:hypothetical protein n=1 Tax=Nonomuraea sp. JJY05 TaxID=3350255 RepID=UPI00373F871E
MTDWLIPLGYLAAMIYTARKTATMLRNTDMVDDGDWFDGFMVRFVGFVAGAVWPLIWAAVLVTGRLPATDHEIRVKLADREMRLAQRDQRIAELERELGMRD